MQVYLFCQEKQLRSNQTDAIMALFVCGGGA